MRSLGVGGVYKGKVCGGVCGVCVCVCGVCVCVCVCGVCVLSRIHI